MGAKILHHNCMNYLRENNIPCEIHNVTSPDSKYTTIKHETNHKNICITYRDDVSYLSNISTNIFLNLPILKDFGNNSILLNRKLNNEEIIKLKKLGVNVYNDIYMVCTINYKTNKVYDNLLYKDDNILIFSKGDKNLLLKIYLDNTKLL